MTPNEFDMNNEGWRGLNSEGKHLEAAERILWYIDQNREKITDKNPSIPTLYFHAGQVYAMAGEEYYPQAIESFKKSYKDNEEWDLYVKGSIAFLNKDKKTLDEAIENNGMNIDILQRFSEALDRQDTSYSTNY